MIVTYSRLSGENICVLCVFNTGDLNFCFHGIPPWEPCTEMLGMATIIGGSCHKYHFCRDKSFVVCREKHVFVKTKHVFCRDKSMLVTTKRLSRQTRVCCDKRFVVTSMFVARNICHDKRFVATKI